MTSTPLSTMPYTSHHANSPLGAGRFRPSCDGPTMSSLRHGTEPASALPYGYAPVARATPSCDRPEDRTTDNRVLVRSRLGRLEDEDKQSTRHPLFAALGLRRHHSLLTERPNL